MENLRKYGTPPFIVAVVHGGPGAAGEMAAVAGELSSLAGVLEPLLTATSVDRQVEDLRAGLEENGRLPLTLIGFSFGAWLSVILAAGYPKYVTLDDLAKRSGRKKNLLLAASLNYFVKATEEEQEKMIRKYLDAYQK